MKHIVPTDYKNRLKSSEYKIKDEKGITNYETFKQYIFERMDMLTDAHKGAAGRDNAMGKVLGEESLGVIFTAFNNIEEVQAFTKKLCGMQGHTTQMLADLAKLATAKGITSPEYKAGVPHAGQNIVLNR